MSQRPAHLAIAALSVLLFAIPSIAQNTPPTAAAAGGQSKVRIVRLSQTRGSVQMARDGRLLETAMNNMPIVEQARLETGMGVAEVEFEDNSTVRLAPSTVVTFTRLARGQSGAALTTIRVTQGMVYANLMKSSGGQFDVQTSDGTVEMLPASHIRLDVKNQNVELAVFKGNARVNTPEGMLDAGRKQAIVFKPGAAPAAVANLQPSQFDEWDKRSVDYHSRAASIAALRNSQQMFGTNDLSYYGSFVNTGGCGSMWRPYFASAAWDPYALGVWAWYEGAGYSWVSPYPWGWTPYHSGTWAYCAGTGWGWLPNGMFTGLDNGTRMRRIEGPTKPPMPPVHPPQPGEPRLRLVSAKPIVRSDVGSNAVVFRRDSAGLGVPREDLGNLAKASREAGMKGEAIRPIYVGQPNGGPVGGQSARALTGTAIRAGEAPVGGGSSNSFALPARPTGGGTTSSPQPIAVSSGPIAGAPSAAK